MSGGEDLYEALGVARGARNVEIRRAYRNLLTREHPDKGGNPERFAAIQAAYDVLSNEAKRRLYDETGETEKTVDEEFMDGFAQGTFKDKVRAHKDGQREEKESMEERLTVRQGHDADSHTSGFEAWLRSRGHDDGQVYTADDIVEKYGVAKGSYDTVPLPNIRAYQVVCNGHGPARDVLELSSEPVPGELEWGEVLINIRAAAINPGDLSAVEAGKAEGGGEAPSPPYVAGSGAIGVVVKVGPGVKNLSDNDWVLPFKPGVGVWRSLAVWKEKDLMKIPADLMPVEYCAMHRELCTAYRLLEDFGNLKPGDAVALNAADSAVGQVVIQLCSLLKLRTVAVVRDLGDFKKKATYLKSLGATEVLPDNGSLIEELGELKFFAKAKLGLDCVGGPSAARLAHCLDEGAQLVVYGCMSGQSPSFSWERWVDGEMQCRGFNLRRWMNSHRKEIPAMLLSLAKLVNNDRLSINYTEYELSSEFEEALDHAMEDGKMTKVILKVKDIGTTY